MRKCVMVTGGASGIGKGISIRMNQEGYQVIVADWNENALIKIKEEHASIDTVHLDISDPDRVAEFFAKWESDGGRLDVLVNNAAATVIKPALDITPSDWDRIMDINLRGAFFCAISAHSLLKKTRGLIINMASIMGLEIYQKMSLYGASKAAMIHLTKVLAAEWRADGIRVQAICPSTVDTPLLREVMRNDGLSEQEVLLQITTGIESGKIQTPEQIAGAVYLMTSSDAEIMTGEIWLCNQGSHFR